MEVINLNLIPNGTNPVVHVSQYDEGREFGFNLFNGTNVLTLDGTEDITCVVKKPDGNIVSVAVPNTSSNSVVVTTTLQMTACGGNSVGVLNISKGGVNLYTLNFILYCEKNPLENGIESDSAIHNLETQIADAVADQYDSNNVIFDNDPTTGHGIGYTVTSEGIKTAIDNAIGGLSIPEELNDLSDVDISGQAQGEALVWNGTKWVNGTVSTVGNLDDLSDVDTTGKATGDSLRYNGVEWVAKPTTVEMTQAEYNAIVDFTPYENTHIVITDAPNLNATASDIEYSSGVSVADELTSLASDKADKSSFNLNSLTGVGCTIEKGGFISIGDCVYLTISVKMTQAHSGDQFLSGLPNTLRNGQCVFGMKDNDTSGVLVSARLSNGNLYVNGNMGNNVTYNFNGILC